MTREHSAVDSSHAPGHGDGEVAADVGEASNDAGAEDGEDHDTCGDRRPRRPISYPCGPESEVEPPLRIELVGFDAKLKRNSYPLKVIIIKCGRFRMETRTIFIFEPISNSFCLYLPRN